MVNLILCEIALMLATMRGTSGELAGVPTDLMVPSEPASYSPGLMRAEKEPKKGPQKDRILADDSAMFNWDFGIDILTPRNWVLNADTKEFSTWDLIKGQTPSGDTKSGPSGDKYWPFIF